MCTVAVLPKLKAEWSMAVCGAAAREAVVTARGIICVVEIRGCADRTLRCRDYRASTGQRGEPNQKS